MMSMLKGQCQVKQLGVLFFLSLLLFGGMYETMPRAQAHEDCGEARCLPVISPPLLTQPVTTTRQTSSNLVISQEVVDSEGYVLTKDDPGLIGDFVTYTIVITNVSSRLIKGLIIADVLPRNAFDKWNFTECPDANDCALSPASPNEESTPPRQISWNLNQLQPGESKTYVFSGRLVCRPDQSILSNEVFVSYEGTKQNHISEITVSASLFPANGNLTLAGPTWCSFGAEGSTDLDWGDFDLDGDLDLVLATPTGAVVYQNNEGVLQSFWRDSDYYATSVRWADVSKSSPGLELVTVGSFIDQDNNLNNSPSNIYQFSGTEFTKLQTFTSDGLYRLDIADYDGDGFMDIAGLFGQGLCLVRLYHNDGLGNFDNDGCVLQNQSGSEGETLAWGNFDNVNGPDLAVISYVTSPDFISTVSLITNLGNGDFSPATNLTNPLMGDAIFNFNWGDYDGNGYLDLVVPLYNSGVIWLFWNDKGQLSLTNVTEIDMSRPAGVDGADFDHDGILDLAVASDDDGGTLKVFTTGAKGSRKFYQLGTTYTTAQNKAVVWTTRSADVDNDGDMDVAIANEGQSVLFTNLGIFLDRQPQFINQETVASANGLVWGDMDSDKDLDLVLGAGADNNALGTTLYKNQQGKFSLEQEFPGLGPRQVALGDYDNDGHLDVAMADSTSSEIYLNGKVNTPIWRDSAGGGRSLAWGDANDDGSLDLLVGADGYSKLVFNTLIANTTNELTNLTINTGYNAASVAWGDYNRDRYLDFAIVNRNGPTQVYCNNRNNTFKLAWQSTISVTGQAVGWADYDQDGDLDLTEGSSGTGGGPSALRIYNNNVCDSQTCDPHLPFQSSQVSCSDVRFSNGNTTSKTLAPFLTGLAWGDADNDGDLDLAISYENRRNVVYFLFKKENGEMSFDANWVAPTAYPTTGVAWGDADGDGDLDLAFSARGGYSMIYYNHYNDTQRTLPNQLPTVTIERPGFTDAGYFYSVGNNFLSGATVPTVTIKYRIFDGDGDGVVTTTFDYSLNGGMVWLPATPIYTPTGTVPSDLLGKPLTFQWDAQSDQAISDNALFRITAYSSLGSDSTARYRYGFTQRATSAATSPPFRVRGTTCVWPETPTFTWYNAKGVERPTNLTISDTVEFQARVATASRGMTFEWNFGAGTTPVKGQVIRRKFSPAKSYPITLTVTSEACPIAKSVVNNSETIFINGGPLVYLPLVMASDYNSAATPTALPDKRPNLVSRYSLDPAQPAAGQAVTITVLVTNLGETLTTQPFYVDLYINPPTAPSTAIPWYEQQHNDEGIQWYIEKPLEPNKSLVLTSKRVTGGLAPNGFSQWTGSFSSVPVTLYSYADSDGHGNPNGVIFEMDEQDNRFPLEASGREIAVQSTTTLPQVADLSGQDSPTAITLTWSAVATDNLMGYQLYRLGITQTGHFQRLATLPATATDYTDSTATCGQMYYLTTFNDTTESDASLTSYFSQPCP